MNRMGLNLKLALLVAALPWLVMALDMVIPADLRWLGIHPRTVEGLPGILLSPLLHGDIHHLLTNTGALFTLTFLGLTFAPRHFFWALLLIIIVGGSLVWTFGGGGAVHLGASGVIFGLLGYQLCLGMFQKSLKAILASAIVFFLYGGIVLNLLVYVPGISWSSHFFGFGAGVLAAWVWRD
jgi:membrane associated rhomboid family serine protease